MQLCCELGATGCCCCLTSWHSSAKSCMQVVACASKAGMKRSSTVCGSTCSCEGHGQVGQASSGLSMQLSMQLVSSTGPHWHW